jgi:hypothetical protein
VITYRLAACAAAIAIVGCAHQGGSSAGSSPAATDSAATAQGRVVKSRDGRFEGEMVGTPAPGSKFAKLQIGMEFNEVTKLIGGASSMHTYETGKRWIPFYFGNEATRMQADYAGEGCLFFTGGSVFGGGSHELVRITADPSGAQCRE